MHGKFSFNLEARGKRREGFDEASGENPVTGEHVAKVVSKNASYNPREQLIAKAVTSAVCLLHLCRARRVDHVELMVDQHLDEHCNGCRMIGAIAVNEYIDVGVDISKHPSNYVAFALQRFHTDDSTSRSRHFYGVVRRVIVIDIDLGRGKRDPEVMYNGLNGDFFIIA